MNVLLSGFDDDVFESGGQVEREKFAQGAGIVDYAADSGGVIGINGQLVADLGSAGEVPGQIFVDFLGVGEGGVLGVT